MATIVSGDISPGLETSGRQAGRMTIMTGSAARHRSLILAVMCAGMFLVQLDVTAVAVALPEIGRDFGAVLAGQQWVMDAYSVALASALLLAGRIGDRVGHRRLVLVGLTLFAAASVACGAASSIGALILARVVQGVGAAALLPSTMAVISETFPEARLRSRAIGIWAGVSSTALPLGPVVGGAVVTGMGWRWVFLLNLPVVALAIPATLRWVEPRPGRPEQRVDLVGAGLIVLGLAAGVHAVIVWPRMGWSPPVAWSAGICGLALLGLVLRQRRAAEPILPNSLLTTPGFVGANLVAVAMNLVGLGMVFALTLYLRTVHENDALTAGLLLLPLFLPLAGMAPFAGRIAARVGSRPPVMAGLAVGVAAGLALLGVRPDSGYARLLPVLLGFGCGIGLVTAPVVAAALAGAGPGRVGLASGVNNAARQAAGAVGIAAFGAVLGDPGNLTSFVDGLHVLGWVAALLWAATVLLAWRTIRSGRTRS